jgi:hypothetical protein
MSPDKEAKLFDDFPELFRSRTEKGSSMCFGFACSDGWFDLIYNLCSDIDSEAKKSGLSGDGYPDVVQVKEKFGGLRFYSSCDESLSKTMYSLIDKAEAESFKICEVCGSKESVTTAVTSASNWWIRSICQKCRDDGRKGSNQP